MLKIDTYIHLYHIYVQKKCFKNNCDMISYEIMQMARRERERVRAELVRHEN